VKMSSAFPSKYLRCADLQGHEVKVKMDRCDLEDIGGDNEFKPVLYFAGKQKGLVLNKTNAQKIAAAYGDETDEWAGQEIFLYPDKTQFQGQMVDCIRIRVPARQVSDGEAPF
jgi:hypothetical protein